MALLNIIFGIAFIYFAYLNLNDTDAWLWVSIYLFAAVCCLAVVFGVILPHVYLILTIFYLVYAGVLFFVKDGVWDWITKHQMEKIATSMQAQKPWIEKTREFFGLLITSGALLLNYFIYG